MSIITHHTALPDSCQKTDFYSLVDNSTTTGIIGTDIASNAAIPDTTLASITTAGKVDGSALNNLANVPSGAGTFPIANIPAITNAKISVGVGTSANNLVALDNSAKLPAVDGSQLTNISFGTVLTGLSDGVSYLAASDGFVYVYASCPSTTTDLFIDASNPPTTDAGRIGTGSAVTIVGTITRKIKAGKYYKVVKNSSTILNYEFWPL